MESEAIETYTIFEEKTRDSDPVTNQKIKEKPLYRQRQQRIEEQIYQQHWRTNNSITQCH